METIILAAPSQNEELTIQITEDVTTLELGFDITDALVEKIDNDFVLTFEETGSSIILEDFYTIYSLDFMPDFVFDDELIAGIEFFEALDENLMPAAGPIAGRLADGGRFYLDNEASLAEGIAAAGAGANAGGSEYTRNSFVDTIDQLPPLPPFVISVDSTLTVSEEGVQLLNGSPNASFTGTPSISGTITAGDLNLDALTIELLNSTTGSLDGTYGTFTLNPNGTFTYTIDNALADSLPQGTVFQETYTLRITDATGLFTDQDITVNVQGTNDQPILDFASIHSADVVTPANAEVEGQMETTDVDAGATATYSVSYINPNLLDDAVYDKVEAALESLKALQLDDKISNLPAVQEMQEFLQKVAAFDLPQTLDDISAEITKLSDAIIESFRSEFDKVETPDVDGLIDNAIAMLESALGGELDKLGDLIGHPISDKIISIFKNALGEEFDKIPSTDVNGAIEDVVESVETILVNALKAPIDALQAEYDAIADKIKDIANQYPLDEALANANNDLNALYNEFLNKFNEFETAIKNADADVWQENNALPTEATTAFGLYGFMTIENTDESSTDGVYTYKLYGSAEEAKASGVPGAEAAYWALQVRDDNEEALPTEHFTIYVQDEHGAWDYKNVSFDVAGANDAPVVHYITKELVLQEAGHGIMVGDTFLANEKDFGTPAAAGIVLATDIDVETLTYTAESLSNPKDVVVENKAGMLELKDLIGDFDVLGSLAEADVFAYDTTITEATGTLYFNSTTGAYIFVIDQDAADSLAEGDFVNYYFNMTVTDGDETVVAGEVSVLVVGTNDKPELQISDNALSVLENDGEVANSVGGTIVKLVDVDNNIDSVNISLTRPELGNETLEALFDSVLNAINIPTDGLVGIVREAITKVYEILGQNPENTPISDLENIRYGDVSADGHTVYGLYGKMELDLASGEYTYTLYTWDEAKDYVDTMAAYLALQHREDNEALPTENFTITVKDDKGAWTYENITVTVNGVDDRPTVESYDEISVQEVGVGITAESLALDEITSSIFSDNLMTTVDGIDVALKAFGSDYSLGDQLTAIENGVKESLLEALKENVTNLPNAANTDSEQVASGEIVASDDDGSVFYTLDEGKASFNAETFGTNLVAEILPELLNTNILDIISDLISTGENIAGIINGNIGIGELGNIIQNAPELSGLADIVDIVADVAFLEALLESAKSAIEYTYEGEYGSLVLNQEGEYTYKLDADTAKTDSLGLNQSAFDSFDVVVYDIYGQKTVQTVTVEIEGTNDKPVLKFADVAEDGFHEVTEDGDAISGKVVGSDVDNGHTLTYLVGTELASVSIEEFSADLAAKLTDGVLANVGTQIDELLKGLNAIPLLGVVLTGIGLDINSLGSTILNGIDTSSIETIISEALKESLEGTGIENEGIENLLGLDEDMSNLVYGEYGTFEVAADGTYTFTQYAMPSPLSPDATEAEIALYNKQLEGYNKVQALNDKSEPITEDFTIYVKDEHGAWDSKDITVTINGVNEAIEFTSNDSVTHTPSDEDITDPAILAKAEGTLTFDTNMTEEFGTSENHALIITSMGKEYEISLENGQIVITLDGKKVTEIISEHGYLDITGLNFGSDSDGDYDFENGSIEYTFYQTSTQANENVIGDEFTVTLTEDKTNASANKDSATIFVNIDDVPVVENISLDRVWSDEFSGTITVDFGADEEGKEYQYQINGTDVKVGVETEIAGLGTIIVDKDGNYTLSGVEAQKNITMTVSAYDGDGSLSEAKEVVIKTDDIQNVAFNSSKGADKTHTATAIDDVINITASNGSGMYAVDGKSSLFGGFNSIDNKLNTEAGNDIVEIKSVTNGMYATNSVSATYVANSINTGADNDKIVIEASANAMYAVGKSQGFVQASASNTIETGAGDDFVSLKGGTHSIYSESNLASNTIDLGTGNDTLHLNGKIEGTHALFGVSTPANDVIGGEGVDTLKLENVNADNTYIFKTNLLDSDFTVENADATFSSFEKFEFGDTNDTVNFKDFDAVADIFTGKGNDTVIGSDYADTIRGGQGSDTLTGGEGFDTFVWKADDLATGKETSHDIITDFEDGDVLDLTSIDFKNITVEKYAYDADGNQNDVKIIIDANNYITLQDVDFSDAEITEIQDALENSGTFTKV